MATHGLDCRTCLRLCGSRQADQGREAEHAARESGHWDHGRRLGHWKSLRAGCRGPREADIALGDIDADGLESTAAEIRATGRRAVTRIVDVHG